MDKQRILMTISCRDCGDIPKIEGTVETFEEDEQKIQLMHNGIKIIEGCYKGLYMTEIIRL